MNRLSKKVLTGCLVLFQLTWVVVPLWAAKNTDTPATNEEYRQAFVDFQNKEFEKAVGILNALVINYPQEPTYYGLLGHTYVQLRKTDMAKINYQRAIDLKTSDPTVYYGLAILYSAKQQYVEQEQLLLKTIAINPLFLPAYATLEDLYVLRATELKKKGETKGALQFIEQAKKIMAISLEAMQKSPQQNPQNLVKDVEQWKSRMNELNNLERSWLGKR